LNHRTHAVVEIQLRHLKIALVLREYGHHR
jgi:hypothetical protein